MVFTEKTFSKCLDKINELNAILFFGKNFGLATVLCDRIRETFKPEETVILDYQDMDKNIGITIHGLLGNDFFSTKKLIKVFNTKPKILKEISFLDEELFNDKLIIFFAPEVDGKTALKTFFEKSENLASISCYEDDERMAIDVIKLYANENNISFTEDAINIMAEMIHGDRRDLLNELEKIKLLSQSKKENITAEFISSTLETEQEFNPFNLFDYILLKQTTKAVKEFQLFKASQEQIIMLTRLFLKNLSDTLTMKQEIENGENIDFVIKKHFIFFKRITSVKKILQTTTIKQLTTHIKIIQQIEKNAKIYGNNIAISLFEKEFIIG